MMVRKNANKKGRAGTSEGRKNKINGTGDFNRLLKSLPRFSVFHVSKFAPDMTDACFKNFLMEKLDISDEQLIAVFPLVKKDADLTKLKFINFGLKNSYVALFVCS